MRGPGVTMLIGIAIVASVILVVLGLLILSVRYVTDEGDRPC